MRAEHAAVGVHFVNHDVTQTIEELRPARVMRQNALVQHIGVGNHNISVQPHSAPGIRGGITIKSIGSHSEGRSAVEFQQLGHLVL